MAAAVVDYNEDEDADCDAGVNIDCEAAATTSRQSCADAMMESYFDHYFSCELPSSS